MTSLLCEHERDELYARVRELERDLDKVAANHVVMLTRLNRERDEAREQRNTAQAERDEVMAAYERGWNAESHLFKQRAERAEAEAARLREVIEREVRRHNPYGAQCDCKQCATFRAVLAGEEVE